MNAAEKIQAEIDKEMARVDRDNWSRAFVYGLKVALEKVKESEQ